MGLGHTGKALAKVLSGFGVRILVHDIENLSDSCLSYGAQQVPFDTLLKESDIISFHVPLNESTRYMVNSTTIKKMKDGVILINVSRGAIFNSQDVFDGLQKRKNL